MIIAHVATIVTQDKTRSYTKQALGDGFIFLAIEALVVSILVLILF
jgi:hypothetical protein